VKLRRRRPEHDVDDLRRQSDQRELGWDAELADEHGQAWHDWGDADRHDAEDHADDHAGDERAGDERATDGGDTIDVTDAATGEPRPRRGPRHLRRR
jgi:hypothetical protein